MRKTIHNGTRQYDDQGTGPVVVLIHGFAENAAIWEIQQAYLKSNFRIITPDLPGAANVPLTLPLTIESMADYVYTILLAENIDKATVVGHSMGGYVALALADKHPQLVQGLGLFHSTATADTAEKKEARRKSIRLMEQYGAETFARQTLPNMFSPAFKTAQPDRVEAYVQMGMQCPETAMVAYYEAMMERPDRTSVLKNVTIPVLFIIGKDDAAVPTDIILPQITLPRLSSIHIFDEVGHMGMWEIYEAANVILRQFVEFCQH
ncbi:alpha/beta fold hydrolase [Chitinophaga qingshengii]|uniref:Alpha/beta hydrolase n=1 Tax=Chitinophaga qingshengii TaxID=1569794 RepID=A0ABR7TJS4_9BACT|nr:alpha/beta hydrolase [Chitinophaga qingshengii]MBC9930741.1 alpha/beta hydrolase [Chitinophaga qingshengii]